MYYLLFIYLLAISFIPLPKKYEQKDKLIRLIFAAVPLILISVMRYGVGADYFSYQYLYDKTSFVSTSVMQWEFPNIDIGFLYLMKGFGLLHIPYWGFVAILSTLQILAMSWWIYRNSENVGLSMVVYYAMFLFVWNFSALRQGLVITFALLLFDKDFEMPVWAEILLILGLSLFHSSALILLLYVISKRINISRNAILVIFVTCIVISLLPFSTLLGRFAHIEIVARFLEYVGTTGYRNLLSFASLARIALFLGTFVFYKAIVVDDYSKNIVNAFLLGFALYLALSFAPVAAGRFASYYYILAILVFPMIVTKVPEVYSRLFSAIHIVVTGALVIFLGVSLMKEISTMAEQTEFVGDARMMPYTTLMNKDATQFKSTYAHLVYDYEQRDERYQEFKSKEPMVTAAITPAREQDTFVSVWSESLQTYIYLNQRGERVTDLTSNTRSPIYGYNIMYPNFYGGYPIDSVYNLVTESISDPRTIGPEVSLDFARSNEYPVTVEMTQNELDSRILALFDDVTQITSILERTFVQNDYKIYEIVFQTVPMHVYTDMDNKPLVDRHFSTGTRLYNNAFIVTEGFKTREIYNLDNTLIWVEPAQSTSTIKN